MANRRKPPQEPKTRAGKVFSALTLAFAIFALPTFWLFIGLTLFLGGDALNGFRTEGRFFISSHGVTTEVSRWTYMISWYLGAIMMGTFIPMIFCSLAVDYFEKRAKDRKDKP